jgi:hypothetical protein
MQKKYRLWVLIFWIQWFVLAILSIFKGNEPTWAMVLFPTIVGLIKEVYDYVKKSL